MKTERLKLTLSVVWTPYENGRRVFYLNLALMRIIKNSFVRLDLAIVSNGVAHGKITNDNKK